MAIATAAGATVTPNTVTSVSPSALGIGATDFPVTITGTGFAANGSTTTLTSTGTDATVTWSSVKEVSSTEITADVTITSTDAAATAGTYGTLQVTDGVSTGTANDSAFLFDAAPVVDSVSPGAIASSASATTVTITGENFVTGAAVSLKSTVDGTSLTVGTATVVNSTTITVSVTPKNSVTGGAATQGTYNLSLVNGDGGTASYAAAIDINPNVVINVSPSSVTKAAANVPVTITGAGFEPGATVSFSADGLATCEVTLDGDAAAPVVNGAGTSIAATFTVANETDLCDVIVTNPPTTQGGNAATFTLVGAFAVGQAAAVAPTITATNATTAIVAGSSTVAVTLTGTGFGYDQSLSAIDGNGDTVDAGTPANGLTLGAVSETGTTYTFDVTVGTGAVAGPDTVDVSGGYFPAAFSVAGPAITSQTPSAIATGAAYGTVITLTGTGFTDTTTGSVVPGGGLFNGNVFYVSPTTMDLVVTASPTDADVTTPPSVELTQAISGTLSVESTLFPLTVDYAPTITGVAYATANTEDNVGVGATAETVYFKGTGFETGATVTKFTNGSGVADPDVTATVTSVTADEITATVAVAAGDTNFADGYTITNPDGGTATTTAVGFPLLIGAAPTITSVSPTTANAGTTTAFTITGTGFLSGAVVTASPSANGLCGAATVVSSTSITVSCNFGATNSTATTLVVTNLDGGTATSATVLAAYVAPVVIPFKVTGAHGTAVAGKTVTMTISGSGFYGQPTITSTAAGTKVGVLKDSGTLLTIHVTTPKGIAGEHTFTVTLANGKSAKANYSIKK